MPSMLTFDTLVTESAAALQQEHPDISPAIIHDVLIDAGIDDCLRNTTPAPQGRLLVHSIHIMGEKRAVNGQAAERFHYQRVLGTGLWAWVGHNGSGKSTILGCILWALTGSDSGVPKRIKPWIRDLAVQFSVGEQPYTSRIARGEDGISGGIYRGLVAFDQLDLGLLDAAVRFDGREDLRESIDRFFMEHLGISTLRWTAHSPEKDDPDLHAHSTTWRTYANAIHIDDDSYDYLIIDPAKGFGRQDRKILEMMLGLEQSRIVSEIQVQADFAKEAYSRARVRLGGRRSNVAEQIMTLEAEAHEVETAVGLIQGGHTAMETDAPVVEKRDRRATLLAEQNDLSAQLSALDAQRVGMERELMEAEREKFAIKEQGEVEYIINSLVVTRCPHCESAVNYEDRLVQERQEHTCHVCSQPMQRTRTQADIRTILRERDQEVSALRQSLQRIQQESVDCQKRVDACRNQSEALGKELETDVQQARDGFNTSYANLLIRKGQIAGQLEQLRQVAAEMDAEQREVDAAARWQIILQTAADVADATVFENSEGIFKQLGELAAGLARQFGVPDLEEVIIDEKRFVRLCQGGVQISHTDLARSERVKFKVAFHLALMLLQVRHGLGRHPAFLIIDTPGTAEVNEADFVAMTRDLAAIQTVYGDKLQIMVATARPESLRHLPTGVVSSVSETATFF